MSGDHRPSASSGPTGAGSRGARAPGPRPPRSGGQGAGGQGSGAEGSRSGGAGTRGTGPRGSGANAGGARGPGGKGAVAKGPGGKRTPPAGVASRRLAQQALVRIERDGAYANLVLPALFAAQRPPLSDRDRRFVTDLVYSTTRWRRACDWYVDRFITTEPDVEARALLRLGAYQLAFSDTPSYAVVSATVDAAPPKIRGFVNAVLRKAAADGERTAASGGPAWPSDAVRLSYPDWIVERAQADLGASVGLAALEAMNTPAYVHERDDGYVQDVASQGVAAAVGATAGERVLDLCAAPGGKATAMAASGASVVAADVRPGRCGLIADNAVSTGVADRVAVVAADGAHPPFRPGSFGRILVDAPCTGLGSLRRRPDARWRIEADAVDRLAGIQRELLAAAIPLLAPGGTLVYSVCTFTRAETLAIDEWLAAEHPDLVADEASAALDGWRGLGRGRLVLPQDSGTDGMYALVLTHAQEASA